MPPRFLLDPEITFLNHGSFGATPEEILARQDHWRRRLEREPVRFVVDELPGAMEAARSVVAAFLGADPQGLAFVPNATTGVNAAVGAVELGPADEILTTNHRYDAVDHTLHHLADRAGARVAYADVPFPLSSPQDIIDAIDRAWTPRTRLLVVDQIASPTALVFPVAALVAMARDRGVPVVIDGAHAPGQLSLDLNQLQPEFWTGNLHKWCCAPKGAAVLWVNEEWRARTHAPVISHGYRGGLHAEFDWCGTFDPSAWLAAADACELHHSLGGASFRSDCHRLVQQGRALVADAMGVSLPHPDDPRLYASMASIPVPLAPERFAELRSRMLAQHRIELPFISWQGKLWLRISGFAAYNRPQDYERLAQLMPEFLAWAAKT